MSSSDLSFYASYPPQSRPRYEVNIAAYVRLSFNEEVELNGWIGEQTMVGESRKTFRHMRIETDVDGQVCKLTFGLHRRRRYPVSGQVMGQPVTGQAVLTGHILDFEGQAGQEPLRYRVDSAGACTGNGRELGIRVVYQPFYSEILGSVERIPDAVMIGLLLPLVLRDRANAYD